MTTPASESAGTGADAEGAGVSEPIGETPPRVWRPWWIAAGYGVAATAWILFSDRALGLLIPQPERWVQWSLFKGLAFVALTATLLWLVLRRAFGAVRCAEASLRSRQAELDRLRRLHEVLAQLNHAMVWTSARDELFPGICRGLVERGGFRTAWIGWHDTDTRRLVPVAEHGKALGGRHTGAVDGDESPDGSGPSARAFREGHAVVCNDIWKERSSGPWRRETPDRGSRSGAILPIRLQGRVWGVLGALSEEPGFFRRHELALLEEVASDTSIALDRFARAENERRAEAIALSERQFSDAMIESMPGVLYFYDLHGRFVRWNRNFETVSGYTGEEIVRMHPTDFFAEADRPELKARIADVFAHGESSIEASFVARDGTATPYYFTGRRVLFNERTCLVGVGIDITDRKRAERALWDLNASLERKVVERTGELEKALTRAESADRLKSAFLASMSHELRTPLNSIIGFTGIVLQGLAGPLTAEQSKQLGMVRGSARHLLELINDVLDISKIEAGQLEVRTESFELPPLIERIVASVQPLAAKKGLSVTADLEPGLGGMASDRRRLEQILLNLLQNAIKFTEVGGVTLSVGMVPDYRSPAEATPVPAVRIAVSDTGMGIRSENLVTLFQPFRQLDTGLERQHEGTGLGLAICRRLATLMGGEIAAASTWSEGSTFTVVLPLKRSSP